MQRRVGMVVPESKVSPLRRARVCRRRAVFSRLPRAHWHHHLLWADGRLERHERPLIATRVSSRRQTAVEMALELLTRQIFVETNPLIQSNGNPHAAFPNVRFRRSEPLPERRKVRCRRLPNDTRIVGIRGRTIRPAPTETSPGESTLFCKPGLRPLTRHTSLTTKAPLIGSLASGTRDGRGVQER